VALLHAPDANDRPEVSELEPEVLQRYGQHRAALVAQGGGQARDEDLFDLEVAARMLRERIPAEQVALAIEVASPEVDERHADAWCYAQQTTALAQERLPKSSATPSPDRTPRDRDEPDIDR
jgi:phage terminase Nu1 subunit (DNA packaging protein)